MKVLGAEILFLNHLEELSSHRAPGEKKDTLASFLKGKNLLLLSDEHVFSLYGEKLKKILPRGLQVFSFVIKPGEKKKSLKEATKILEFMVHKRFLRDDAVMTLGGGVVGDLGGFVASIYMRGISWINFPTTLLAMVDASIGGKTGVNVEAKNIVGSFYQPRAVFLVLDFLKTLPPRLFNEGMAEVIKYGVIQDARFFSFLRKEKEKIKKQDKEKLFTMIQRSVAIKKEVVERDEKEAGWRKILNYGHTLGHALEAYGAFQGLHGEAVSAGMHYAALLAQRMGILKDDRLLPELLALLTYFSLPVKASGDFSKLLEFMAQDKKARKEGMYFVLPERIGKVIIARCSQKDLKQAWLKLSS